MHTLRPRIVGRLAMITTFLLLALPCLAQTAETGPGPAVMGGYLYQTQITADSYLLTNSKQLKSFVEMLPPHTPFKVLPAPPNLDPFLHDFTVDFSKDVVAVAVRRNGITDAPTYLGTQMNSNGVREVHFKIAAPTTDPYPLGWAVYSAVVLPRAGRTAVVVTTAPPLKKRQDSKFPRLGE